jgi:membrane-bound lytic murein transglycosylase D
LVVLASLAASTTTVFPADDEEVGLEDLLEAGRQMWDEYAPEEIKEQYDFPTVESIEVFLTDLQRTLAEGSFEDLAAYEMQARNALPLLRQFEGGDEVADWLAPRLDFLTAAENEVQTRPPLTTRDTQERGPLARPYWDRVAVSRQPPANATALVPRLKNIFRSEGVPPEWVWIAEVESSMNPKARSPVGARGLFQFMPATAERFGMRVSWPDERTDPEKSARAAAHYLTLLYKRFDSWPLAIAAYNAGEGRVGRALNATGTSSFAAVAPHLPAETRLYVPKVMATVAARESIADPERLPAPGR